MPDFDAAKSYHQIARSRGRGLVAGIAAVTAGLGLFWYAQQKYEEKKEACPAAAAVSTWEYRMGQEQQPSPDPQQQGSHRTSDPIESVEPRGPPIKKKPTPSDDAKDTPLEKAENKVNNGEHKAKQHAAAESQASEG